MRPAPPPRRPAAPPPRRPAVCSSSESPSHGVPSRRPLTASLHGVWQGRSLLAGRPAVRLRRRRWRAGRRAGRRRPVRAGLLGARCARDPTDGPLRARCHPRPPHRPPRPQGGLAPTPTSTSTSASTFTSTSDPFSDPDPHSDPDTSPRAVRRAQPENVLLLDRRGGLLDLRIADFGEARRLGPGGTITARAGPPRRRIAAPPAPLHHRTALSSVTRTCCFLY